MEHKNIEKTEEMVRFERETGKKAIWREEITNEFKKWINGKKIYHREGERWTIYLNKDLDEKWREFLSKIKLTDKKYNQTKLCKDGVNLLIEFTEELNKIGKNYEYESFKKYVKNAIVYFSNEGLISKSEIRADFIRTILPLRLFIQLIKENINNPEELTKLIEFVEDATEELEGKINVHFEQPTTKRFVRKVDVLHIENNELSRKALKYFFEKRNYTYKSAENAELALYELKNITPNLILIDIGLPGNIKGDTLCKILKTKEEYKKVPIILLTSMATEENKEKIKKECNADDIILKSNLKKLEQLNVLLKYLKK